jgi:hypothetical protein
MYPYDRLVQTHLDDVRRSAALYHHAVQARPPRTPRREPMTTALAALAARIHVWRIRPVSPQS